MAQQRAVKRVGHVAAEVDRHPVLLVHVVARTHRAVTVAQLHGVVRVDLDVVELPLAREVEQAELLAPDFEHKGVRAVGTAHGHMRKRHPAVYDFAYGHASVRIISLRPWRLWLP